MKLVDVASAGAIAVSATVAPQTNPWLTIGQHVHPSPRAASWGEFPLVQAAEPPAYRAQSSAAARGIAEERRPQDGAALAKLAAEVAAMKSHLRELEEARARDQRRIDELIERIRSLELEVIELMAEREDGEDGEEVVTNAHQRWIEQHLDVLRAHPHRWVAIDAARGIVAEAHDGDELADKVDVLSPEEQARLVFINTALYV